MPEVHLAHVLFTRVEKAYSPRGTSGYQVVYHTLALEAETLQIEKQVQCFQINHQQMVRYQFFWTTSGQAVCARTVSLLAPNREVIDRDQRDAFLAHALVLSRADFTRLRNDPFALFAAAERAQILAGQVEQLVGYLRATPPPQRLSVPMRTWTDAPLACSPEELRQLYRLATAAPVLSGQRQSIQMIASDPGDVFRLLSSLLLLLPADERVACTFDTFADTCSPSPGSLWTVGGTRAPGQSGFLPMRLAERQIASIRPSGQDSLYTSWFLQMLQDTGSLAWLPEDLLTAQLIAESFSARTPLPDQPLSERALGSFRRLHSRIIEARIVQALAAVMEQRLAGAFVPSLLAVLPLPVQLDIAATGACEVQFLAGLLYTWFLQAQPAWKEWDDVLEVAIRASSAPLLLLASLKAHPRPFKHYGKLQVQAIQSLLASGQLPPVLADLSAWDPLAPGAESTSDTPVLSDEEFQTLVLVLVQQQAGHVLQASCARRATHLQQRKIVLSLSKAAAAQGIAPEFVAALQQHPLSGKEKGQGS